MSYYLNYILPFADSSIDHIFCWLCIFHSVSPCDLDLRIHKCIQLKYKLLSINWPNIRKIRWKMAEKSQNADSGKEIKIIIIIKTRLDQSNVLDWKVSSIFVKDQVYFITYHVKIHMQIINPILLKLVWAQSDSWKILMTSYLCNRKFLFSTTTVENLKWFGKELTKLWMDTPNKKEIICIYLAIDPKGQGDLQDYMVF